MGTWDAWIGNTQSQSDLLTPRLLNQFRATLDDPSAQEGVHWCLCPPDTTTAELGADGHPPKGGFLPPVPLPRRMWASSAVTFLAPLTAGAVIERTSTVASVAEKSGATGPLVFVEVDRETRADGALALVERQTIVYREQTSGPPPLRAPDAAPDLSEWQWHCSLAPSAQFLFRYSALTFNTHRIHYDLPYAQGEEGYRGLVVHGPLIATLLLRLIKENLPNEPIRHFSMRGQSPAIAGDTLHLVGRRQGNAVTLAALGHDARLVMSAEAEV